MFENWAAQLDIPGGWGDFKENWDQWTAGLNLPDLASWDSFKEWFDNLGLPDLSGIDLGIGLSNFKTEWNNLFSGLSLDGVNLNIGEQLQNAVNSVFGDPKSLLDKLQMLKNPFFPAIQPDYLIEFAKGGLLHGLLINKVEFLQMSQDKALLN
jgi:hypothetical protein